MSQKADNLTQIPNEGMEHYLKMPALLRDLLLQLIKDFQTALLPVTLDPDELYSFEGLCQRIETAMDEHLQRAGTLKNLLNRVDLSEKQIKKVIPGALNTNLRMLSELIVKRELQKVVIRYWYQQASDK
jgi:cellulose biosynthesis protein BcsQ